MKQVFIASLVLGLTSIACCSLLVMGDSRSEIVGGYCTIPGSSISLRGIVECKNTTYVILPNLLTLIGMMISLSPKGIMTILIMVERRIYRVVLSGTSLM